MFKRLRKNIKKVEENINKVEEKYLKGWGIKWRIRKNI